MQRDSIEDLTRRIRDFAEAREWEQFHLPKNLAMALAVEVAELMEHFQWLTASEAAAVKANPEAVAEIASEIADVQIYLLRLADVLGVDVAEAVHGKLAANAARYPVELARGRATVPADHTRVSNTKDRGR